MNRKTGLVVNFIGALLCVILLGLNFEFNLVVKLGFPVEMGILIVVLELVFAFWFNVYLNREEI